LGITAAALPPLLPRYRRPFSVGDVLDDTIRVFRQVWLRMIGLNLLVAVLGVLIVGVVVGAFVVAGGMALFTFFVELVRLGAEASAAAGAGRPTPPVPSTGLPSVPESAVAVAAIFGVAAMILSALLTMAWYGAMSLMTDRVVRGQRLGVGQALAGGLHRAPALLGAGFLYFIGVALAAAIAFAIVYVLRAWTFVAALVAVIALGIWAANRNARQTWLKWLIVVATPFGLPFYLTVAWSLFVPAGAVERAGPIRALQRSAEFVSGHWFRVLAMWLVMSIIVSLLQAIPGAIVGALFVGLGGANLNTPQGIDLALNVAQIAGSYLGGAVFGALPMSAATLTFIALRNQREGTDLAERLAAFEAPPAASASAEALGAPGTPTTLS
jgi:hypothetical protein